MLLEKLFLWEDKECNLKFTVFLTGLTLLLKVLEEMDVSEEEAARTMGANEWEVQES